MDITPVLRGFAMPPSEFRYATEHFTFTVQGAPV